MLKDISGVETELAQWREPIFCADSVLLFVHVLIEGYSEDSILRNNSRLYWVCFQPSGYESSIICEREYWALRISSVFYNLSFFRNSETIC